MKQAIDGIRQAVLILLLATAAVTIVLMLAKTLGVQMPIRIPDHVALAYIAGVYWLTR